MSKVRTFFALVVAVASIITVANAHGQTIGGISESGLDFGCVALGGSSTDMVTVTNNSATEDIFVSVSMSGSAAFSTDFVGAPVVLAGNSRDINVTFEPTAIGDANGELIITVIPFTSEPEEATVDLVGTGGTTDDPCDLITDILNFFDDAIANGTLEGTGNHPNRRVRAMRNRLRAVRFLVCHGYFCQAAYINRTAILRSDGQSCPGDFVQGSDLQAFNYQLECLQILLE